MSIVYNTFSLHQVKVVVLFFLLAPLSCVFGAPRENPYDVIAKVFTPFWKVLLSSGSETKTPHQSMIMVLRMTSVTGRLPKEFEGATLHAWVQFPDKLKLQAPVLGESAVVCRDQSEVWAIPGKKIEFLLSKFQKMGPGLPEDLPIPKTPLPLPITAQQAVFLPALFTIKNAEVAEVVPLNGEDHRLITAGLMPELAKAIDSEDFLTRLWVEEGYKPKRVEVARRDFTCRVDITELKFVESLPEETWKIPADSTDVFRTSAHKLQAVLFVVMNSLQAN